jgi:hypothetical protein
LVAPTEELFYQTVSFYADFGFDEVSVYDRALPDTERDVCHCITSDKETWLLARSERESEGTDVTLKIRYVRDAKGWRDGVGEIPPPGVHDHDWRG